LLHHFNTVPSTADDWSRRLGGERDPGIRQALVLLLGMRGDAALATSQSEQLRDTLLGGYRDDPDSGVHGAADWTLRQLGHQVLIEHAIEDLARQGPREGFYWFVSKSKLTMVVVGPTGPTRLGSPEDEPGRDESDETAWTADVDWVFAISATEV